MAGVIFLIVFFTLGTLLVLLVNWALQAENARYGGSESEAPPTPEAAERPPVQAHDRAA
jgi:hypothetical protein